MENLLKKIDKQTLARYQKYLVEQLDLSPSTTKRRLSSARKFFNWAYDKGYLQTNPLAKEEKIVITQEEFSFKKPFVTAYKKYHSFTPTRYLHWALLIIFCAALGFGAYEQFFKRVETPLAYPSALTRPNRYLSFQGRLTDSSDNPITSATNITFKLYDAATNGNTLWNSDTCSVTPDQDGIFSLLLGTTSGTGYTCGSASEIAATVFSENQDVYLGVTVDTDDEMTPRIQIATVGYALNAETLQGYPPGTTASTIPYINSSGNVVIAAASPLLQASSGTFAIEGQTGITIQTTDGQDGTIALAPKGTGTVTITSEAETGDLVSNQSGANFGNTGGKEENNLYYGYLGNDSTNANLLKLEAGAEAAPKFTLDASGNASAAGILKALTTGSYFTGDINVSGGDITGANSVILDIGEADANYITSSVGLAVGGAQTYYINNSGTGNLNALTLAGDLTIDTNDLFVDVSENKIGIGTTTLTEKLTLAGNATISGTLALAPNVQVDAGTCNAAAAGKMYYDGDENKYYFCDGSSWTEMGSGSGGGDSWWTQSSGLLYPVNETLDLAVGGTSTAAANVKLGASSDSDSFIYGGNVGIGTTGPDRKLDVLDASNPQLRLTQADDSVYADFQMNSNGDLAINVDGQSNQLVLDNGGNLGIGTDNPSEKLEVAGNLVSSGTLTLGSSLTGSENALSINTGAGFSGNFLKLSVDSTQKLAIDSTGMLTTASGVFTSTVADAADATGFKLITPEYTTSGAKLLSVYNNTDEKMSLDKDGVLALYNSESMIYNASGDITIDAASGNISFATNNLINIDDLIMGGTASISGTPNITLIPTTGFSKLYLLNGGDLSLFNSVGGDAGVVEKLRFTNTGNLGIEGNLYDLSDDTLTINDNLSVAGTASFNSDGVTINGSNFVNAAKFIDTANSDYFVDPAAAGTAGSFYGKVGIGNHTPSMNLDITGNATISGTLSLGPNVQVDAGTCNAAATGKMYYDGDNNAYYYCDGTSWTTMGETAGLIAAFSGSCPSGWTEYTAARGRTIVGTPSGGTDEGTVGTALTDLGTRTITDVPAHTHDIKWRTGSYGSDVATTFYSGAKYTWETGPIETVGSASVDVTMPYIQLTYCEKDSGSDLAEWIPTSEDVSSATIVSVYPDNREKVIASRKAYDPTVIGIVATQPGWLIGEEKEDSVQMALSGRVPTRVSLINGEIKPGDPITTSPIPGVGMKATKNGPIVGKAMEFLNESSSLNNCLNPENGQNEKCGEILVFVNPSWFNPEDNQNQEDALLAQASNDYYELLRINDDLSEGDLVGLRFYEAPNQNYPSQMELVSEIKKTYKQGTFVGVISKTINGNGDLLRRERINNQIISETRLVYGTNSKVKVSSSSKSINIGDQLTISDEKGMAEKAKKYGPTIGKALETWSPDSKKTTIRALITSGWYDPDIYLTSAGELNITGNPELGEAYQLKDSSGNLIEKIGAFTEIAVAKIKAGLINTQELVAEKQIISPLIEGEEIQTNRINLSEINPSNEEGNITFNLQTPPESSTSSGFGKLVVKGQEGQEVASIDAQGNASFSGQVNTENLEVANDATVAGTLYADEIVTKHGKFGDLLVGTMSATYVTQNITNVYQNEASNSSELIASDSANLFDEVDDIEALIAEILNTSISNNEPDIKLTEDINLPNNGYTFEDDLLVLGTTSLSNATITDSLNIGGTLSLVNNSIDIFSGPLYLQSLGLGGIDILAGKIVIDEHGNATFEGDVTIKGKLTASSINPLPENDLVIDLAQIPIINENETESDLSNQATQSAFGKLLVKGFEGQIVASIDASGSAYFASLDLEADYSATQSGTIIAAADNYQENGEYSPAIKTNATTGVGFLPANESEIMIYNPKITEQSLIYITPITDTENKVVYVKAKKAEKPVSVNENNELIPKEKGWFKVAIDAPINQDIQFNWWIVN